MKTNDPLELREPAAAVDGAHDAKTDPAAAGRAHDTKTDPAAVASERDTQTVLGVAPSGARCIGRGRCCENNPGWFAPGEMEAAAAHLGLSPEEFFARYVVIVNVRLDDEPGAPLVEAYAPAKADASGAPLDGAGKRASRAYRFMRGPCIFYRDRRCAIHPARPLECRNYWCEQPDAMNTSKQQLARLWYDAWRANR